MRARGQPKDTLNLSAPRYPPPYGEAVQANGRILNHTKRSDEARIGLEAHQAAAVDLGGDVVIRERVRAGHLGVAPQHLRLGVRVPGAAA